MKTANRPKTPLWKKSMLAKMDLASVRDALYEIAENGDAYGYEYGDEAGYYAEYKDQFDELAAQAGILQDSIDAAISEKYMDEYEFEEQWNDITVAMLGELYTVLGFDCVEMDYYGILAPEEEWAQEEARKRLERLTKAQMLDRFAFVWKVLILFYDLKAEHDCLVAIVEELDEKGALLERKNDAIDRKNDAIDRKNDAIDRIYEDITGKSGEDFDAMLRTIPQRMWVE